MKCENMINLMMDYLYNEIKANDKEKLMKHMSECEKCRKEFIKLQDTSLVLQKMEDVDPNLNLVFVQEETSFWGTLRERLTFSPKKLVYGFGYGFAAIMLLLSIINTELSIKDGEFSLKMSLLGKGNEQVADETKDNFKYSDQAQLAQMQQQNINLMKSLIQESENRQRQQLISTLSQFSRDIDFQRTNDLKIMNAGLTEIEKSVYSKLEQKTNTQFNSLIHYINSQQGNR